jgi:hypothetical protein
MASPQIGAWMKENERSDLRLLKCYASGLQVLAKHVLHRERRGNRLDALHRERAAAKAFLSNVVPPSWGSSSPRPAHRNRPCSSSGTPP